jgi:3-hydroxypropanoate dehydrogenase
MHRIVNDEALDTLFRAARSRYAWLARPVSDTMLRAIWELVKLGPTSGAGGPPRVLFVRSEAAKARLGPAVAPTQRAAILTAPLAAIVGYPLGAGTSPAVGGTNGRDRREAALRDAALDAAYLIVACRALGLDCGPVWEFDKALVDAAFFPEGTVASHFLCALGYGDESQLSPDEGQPGAAEACRIL